MNEEKKKKSELNLYWTESPHWMKANIWMYKIKENILYFKEEDIKSNLFIFFFQTQKLWTFILSLSAVKSALDCKTCFF